MKPGGAQPWVGGPCPLWGNESLPTNHVLGSLQSNHPPQSSPPQPQHGRAASPRDCHLPGAVSQGRRLGCGYPIPNCSFETREIHFGALLTQSSEPPAAGRTTQRAALCPPVFRAPAPCSWAECECLLGAFLTAHSMAGVIQRQAEASAATETTMKRKQSSKNSPFINQLNCR